MLLAVDIGNTNIVLGYFKGSRLAGRMRMPSDGKFDVNALKKKFDAAVIASVVPKLTRIVVKKIWKKFGVRPIVVDWKKIKDLKIGLKNKGQIGIDRLINAAAVKALYGCPAIVIDFGTATTFCVLDKRGAYRGGVITSGLAISRDVLHERTAKLPLIRIQKPRRAIGGNTVEAMRSGLFYGYIEMVEGMVRRMAREIKGKPKVIATGGLAKVIAKGTKIFDYVDQDLTLKGLNIIYRGLE